MQYLKLLTSIYYGEHLKTEREKCFKMYFSFQNKLNGQNIKEEKTTYQSKHLKMKKEMFKSINAVSIPVVLGTPASP